MIHTVKGFSIVNEAEVGVFLEFPCFLYDPVSIGNLISGSSAFSKSSWYLWKFSVHILLKPSLKDFEHNLASMWNEHNCMVVWTFFGIAFVWFGIKTDFFQYLKFWWYLKSYPSDFLEKEMATYSRSLAWRIHGQRSLAGYSPWGRKESDTTEQLTHTHTWTSTYLQFCSLEKTLSILSSWQ